MDNIPDISRYEKILEAASRGKLILFIGAGVSRLLGCPSWSSFAKKVLDDACKKHCIDYRQHELLLSKFNHDPRKLLSICQKAFIKFNKPFPDYKAMLKHSEDNKLKPNDVYVPLYSTNCIFITTNYDDYLANAAKYLAGTRNAATDVGSVAEKIETNIERNTIDIGAKVFYREEDLIPSKLESGNILHIHGSFNERAGMVISLADYFVRYRLSSPLNLILSLAFENHTVLFMGYGLEEYEILEFMLNKMNRNRNEIRHYMLLPSFDEDQNIIDLYEPYYSEFGVQIIPYSRNNSNYEQLSEVIIAWSKKIKEFSASKKIVEKFAELNRLLKDE
jgi:hypothetical protein